MSLDTFREITRTTAIIKLGLNETILDKEESITRKRDSGSLVRYAMNHRSPESHYAILEKLRYGRYTSCQNFAAALVKAVKLDDILTVEVNAYATQDAWKTEKAESEWLKAHDYDASSGLCGVYEREWINEHADDWNNGFDGSISLNVDLYVEDGRGDEVMFSRNVRRLRRWLYANGLDEFVTDISTPYGDYSRVDGSWYETT